MLVDHADAEGGCGLRIGDPLDRAVDGDLAAVRGDEADEDPHQRRLAGTVLPEDAVHLTAMEVEIDGVAGDDVSVALGDVADRDGGMRPVSLADRPHREVGHSSDQCSCERVSASERAAIPDLRGRGTQ